MKKLLLGLSLLYSAVAAQNFTNPLRIPPLVTGTNFQLNCLSSTFQIYPGQPTATFGINGPYLGPTMVFNSGDSVRIDVLNQLNDETSMHWHGLHVPAEMDGGPETVIPAGGNFTAAFKVMDRASTYWYHPHVHMKTQEQVNMGLAGLIIVKDSVESALSLPRNYGIDDFPIILQDRSYTGSNQFFVTPLGDSMLVNGTARPYLDVPAQMVRLRLLNGSNARVYNLGFSDNRNFHVIGSDGGLLPAPFLTNRIELASGERVELLVNFDMQVGRSFQLRSFATALPVTVPGNMNVMMSGNSPLERTDFDILEFRVSATLPGAVFTAPVTLASIQTWDTLAVNRMRYRTLTGQGSLDMGSFYIDGNQYIMGYVNDTMRLGDIERWNVTNLTNISHPMHIHSLSFRILSRNGVTPPASESGWKDVFHILPQETVSLIMRFEDYTNTNVPYMYHCHLLAHEDMGMMTSFIVVDTLSSQTTTLEAKKDVVVFPNPTTGPWHLNFPIEKGRPLQVSVNDMEGRTVLNSTYDFPYTIPTSGLNAGCYVLNVQSSDGTIKKVIALLTQ